MVSKDFAHKRHTTLYEEIEGGLLPPPLVAVAAPAVVHKIKRKAVPTASASAAAAVVSVQPATFKPLPPVPAPGSPRRYTRGFVPQALAMNDNGYPMMEKLSRREQQEKEKEAERVKKEKSGNRSQIEKVRAVEKALRKFF